MQGTAVAIKDHVPGCPLNSGAQATFAADTGPLIAAGIPQICSWLIDAFASSAAGADGLWECQSDRGLSIKDLFICYQKRMQALQDSISCTDFRLPDKEA